MEKRILNSGFQMLFFCLFVILGFYFLLVFDGPLARWVQSPELASIRKFASGIGYLGHGVSLTLISSIIYLFGICFKKPKFSKSGIQAFVTLILSGLLSQTMKHLTGRSRPRLSTVEYFGLKGPTFESGWDSFPSGHAIAVFAVATILAKSFPRHSWIFYSMAALVALCRVFSGSHFLTDVFAGACLGFLLGYLVINFTARWFRNLDG